MPTQLLSTPLQLVAYLYEGETQLSVPVNFSASLAGTSMPNNYFSLDITGPNTCVLQRLKMYNKASLLVSCQVNIEDSPTGESYMQEISLSLGGLE